MKKLILIFAFFPLISQAQFVSSFFQLFGDPMNAFYLDTSLYQSGLGQAKDYTVDVDGNLNLFIDHTWQTEGNRFVKKGSTYPNATSYDYFETQYSFKEDRPFQTEYFRRLKDQTLLEPTGIDSMAFEDNRIKNIHRLTGNQNAGTITEYFYDSINGVKGNTVKLIPPSTEYTGIYNVREFHQPQLPKIIDGYSESATERKLFSISHYYFDSLNRVSSAIDSSLQFGVNMIFRGTRRIVYIRNTMLVDSIIQESQYFKYYYVSIISYDTHQKIAQINRYGQETNRPYRLLQRIEFGNPASGINQKENDKITFSLFPNPSSDKVYLQSDLPIQSVQILDINAKVVLTAIAENVSQLEIGNLPSGIYLIEASSKNGKVYKRFVKSN